MKKFFAILFCIILILILTACPQKSNSTSSSFSSQQVSSVNSSSSSSSQPISSANSSKIISSQKINSANSSNSDNISKKSVTINIGDYLLMGKYYNEPILWRCVDIDENGLLMFSDKIITIKVFDATGNHKYSDGTPQPDINGNRAVNGSNLWETSNMRSWLNSNATAGNVKWPDGCPPVKAEVWGNLNPYSKEKGFLAEGNFTSKEINIIKTVTQKSLINNIDAEKLKAGGTVDHIYNYHIDELVQNYDVAYYQNITDKMFLLDVKQVYKVYQNYNVLGENYHIGYPTQKAVDNSENKDNFFKVGNDCEYWLRSPKTDDGVPVNVRVVGIYGIVGENCANSPSVGVRPAFYMNSTLDVLDTGNGSSDNPYKFA